ncbi:hypothetical protein Y032_0058g2928 [Ancylostoma ceylanicum]|uniref:Uncharacterized protein n=1 Tax=Ancylostoma ceylanicum TaxID=53326 RepID=A0A016U582_9BILA|nr:hypothetical protein Y032_0058g2928 [Ancylostoma ceylanicum]
MGFIDMSSCGTTDFTQVIIFVCGYHHVVAPRGNIGSVARFEPLREVSGRTAAAIRKNSSSYSEGPQQLFGRTAAAIRKDRSSYSSVLPVFCCGPSENLSEISFS